MSVGNTYTSSKASEPRSSTPGVDSFAHFVIERYEDGRLATLGSGAMGITYRAFDTKLERSVALKLIHPQYVDDPGIRTRFAREAKAAARLQHPNIASVLFQGEEGPSCFYVMELVNGENLHSFIQRNGPISPLLALKIAQQIALALAVAAREGIIHRDLKPGNVMLVCYHAGRDPDAKVIDFGLAKLMAETSATQLSSAGFIGTPEFASPEQCEEKPLDERSDLYSLGATLWFMLTGQPLFIGSMLSIVKSHVEVPPPFDTLPGAPDALVGILQRLLAKDPADRPQNGVVAADEIEQVLRVLASNPANSYPLCSEEVFQGPPSAPQVITPSALTLPRSTPRVQMTTQEANPEPRLPSVPEPKRVPLIAIAVGAMAFLLAASIGIAIFLYKPKPVGRPITTFTEQPSPPPTALIASAPVQGLQPASAAPGAAMTGSLGWSYVQIQVTQPFQKTIFVADSEVTVDEFAKFIAATGYPARGNWKNPGFAQTPRDPVVNVTPIDAMKFCEWLTEQERAKGVITQTQVVRLPARYEFDACVPEPRDTPPSDWGVASPSQETPPPPPGEQQPPQQGPDGRGQPPGGGGGAGRPAPPCYWGFRWPPPPSIGNFADQTALNAGVTTNVIPGYDDGYAWTCPVGSFGPSRLALFDIEGNVHEWSYEPRGGGRVGGQGGSFLSYKKAELSAHGEIPAHMNSVGTDTGFRCVVGEPL